MGSYSRPTNNPALIQSHPFKVLENGIGIVQNIQNAQIMQHLDQAKKCIQIIQCNIFLITLSRASEAWSPTNRSGSDKTRNQGSFGPSTGGQQTSQITTQTKYLIRLFLLRQSEPGTSQYKYISCFMLVRSYLFSLQDPKFEIRCMVDMSRVEQIWLHFFLSVVIPRELSNEKARSFFLFF